MDKETEKIIEAIQAMQKQGPARRPPKTKTRYMKKVVNLIFITAFVLTVVYLYLFWKYQLEPATLIMATFAFLGVEAVALAKIRWEEEKGAKHEQDQSESEL